MKRFSAIVVMATIILVLFAAPVLANKTDYVVEDFNDLVNANGVKHWAYDQISDLIAMGIFKGYDGGTVYSKDLGQVVPVQLAKPNQKVTRAEFAVLLYQLLNLPPQENGANFQDEIPAWAQEAVNTLYNAGIVKGDPDGNFNPNAYISRAEIATMIVKSLNDQSDETGKYFPDIPSQQDHWAYAFIQKASAMGIVNGLPDGTFKPDRSAQRSEVAVMLDNFIVKDRSQAPDDSVLLARTDGMLKVMEDQVNSPGTVDLSAARQYLTGREEATLDDSASALNDMKQQVSISYQVTYPGTVVDKSDRWAEVEYDTLITVTLGDKQSQQHAKEHYYLMKMGDGWYVYSDSLEEL